MASRSVGAEDARLGGRLRARRLELGLSMKAVAAALGVTVQQIQKYESGRSRLAAARLPALCRRLAVPIPWFFPGLEAPLGPLPDSREVAALVRHFLAIADPELRRRLGDLVRAVADDAAPAAGDSRPSGRSAGDAPAPARPGPSGGGPLETGPVRPGRRR